MLIWFVILYIAVSVAIGLYAARRVKTVEGCRRAVQLIAQHYH